MTKTKMLVVALVIVSLPAFFASYKVFKLSRSISSDEHATCTIQSRALPANKALAATLNDINELLTIRSEKGSARAVTLPARDVPYLLNLKAESGMYVQIEAKQPGHRTC